MEKKPKANSVISTELVDTPEHGPVIIFKVKDAGEARLVVGLLSETVRKRATYHGLIQKVSDAAAIPRDTATGKSATPQDKLSAMQRVVEHFASGTEEWNAKREGGGGGLGAETQLLVRALGSLYPKKSAEELLKWVRARSAAERSSLMAQENIKVIVDKLRSEASSGVDAGALLAGLEGEEETGE